MNKIKLTLLIIAPILLTMSTQAFGSGYELQEQSAVTMGRALAVTAKLDDPSVVFHNPAGMAYLEGLNLSFGAELVVPLFKYVDPAGVHKESSLKMIPATPVHFYVTYGITKDIAVGGGAVIAPWGQALEWEDGFAGEHLTSSADLKIPMFLLDAAWKFWDGKISIGAFFNWSPTSIELAQKFNVVDSAGSIKKMKVLLGGNGHGFGGGGGIMIRPIPGLYIGASYRSRMSIDLSGAADFQVPEGVDDHSTFQDQDIETNFKTPDVIAIGIGYDISESLYLEFDINYTIWSVNDFLEVEFMTDSSLNMQINQDWNSGLVFRLAGEYKLSDNLILRCGGGYDQSPVPDATLSPMLPGSDRIFGTMGGQYFFRKLGLNLAFSGQYTYFVPRSVDAEDNENHFGQEYTNHALLFGFTIGYNYK